MAKLPRFTLTHDDGKKPWALKADGPDEVIKRFEHITDATKG